MSLPSGLQVRDTMWSRAIPGRIQLAVSKVLLSGALRSWGLDQGIALRPLLQCSQQSRLPALQAVLKLLKPTQPFRSCC